MKIPCVFCAIVAGEAPASTIYRDDAVIAFMDIRPVNPGHALVVPLRHSESLLELDEGTAGHMLTIGTRVAAALKEAGVRLEGFNLFLADGAVAGQTVFHVHLHVLPRFAGDGLGFRRPADMKVPLQSQLDETAERIRRAGGWE